MIRLFFVAASFFIYTCADAQSLSADEQAIHRSLATFFDALAVRDTITMKNYCTKDLIILEDKEVWNLDTLNRLVGSNKDTSYKRVNRFDIIETKVTGNTGWTCYHNYANISRRGKNILVQWLETAIFVKENKTWKMRVLHSTTVERKQL